MTSPSYTMPWDTIFLVKTQTLQITQDVIQAAGQQVISSLRQTACEETEGCLLLHSYLNVSLQHRKLVEVGEQREIMNVVSWEHRLYVSLFFKNKQRKAKELARAQNGILRLALIPRRSRRA